MAGHSSFLQKFPWHMISVTFHGFFELTKSLINPAAQFMLNCRTTARHPRPACKILLIRQAAGDWRDLLSATSQFARVIFRGSLSLALTGHLPRLTTTEWWENALPLHHELSLRAELSRIRLNPAKCQIRYSLTDWRILVSRGLGGWLAQSVATRPLMMMATHWILCFAIVAGWLACVN